MSLNCAKINAVQFDTLPAQTCWSYYKLLLVHILYNLAGLGWEKEEKLSTIYNQATSSGKNSINLEGKLGKRPVLYQVLFRHRRYNPQHSQMMSHIQNNQMVIVNCKNNNNSNKKSLL